LGERGGGEVGGEAATKVVAFVQSRGKRSQLQEKKETRLPSPRTKKQRMNDEESDGEPKSERRPMYF